MSSNLQSASIVNFMSTNLRSKLGIFLAGAYLLLVLYSLIEYSTTPTEIMSEFGLHILTAPGSFLLAVLFDWLGIMTNENSDSLIYLYAVFGGLINASILYFLGLLLTKLFNFLGSLKP